LSIFVGLDYFFDWALIQQAIVEKSFVLVGFAGFIILAALAVTSTRGWKRRLKKKWKPLHRSVYLAGVLVILHYIWLVKSDIREPLIYGGILVFLLAFRIPVVRNVVVRFRQSVQLSSQA
ncbi:MAG TPA: ferric reductase-like transmembrane domain-containing protein, partial [bacterium]|nr:ferric reductase-like transmembrane domain-containing protein [bacterium]